MSPLIRCGSEILLAVVLGAVGAISSNAEQAREGSVTPPTAAAAKPAPAPLKTPSLPPAPAGYRWFKHEQAKLAFVVPIGWMSERLDAGKIIVSGKRGTEAYCATITVQLADDARHGGAHADCRSAAKAAMADVARLPAGRVLAAVVRQVAGLNARLLLLEYTMRGEAFKQKQFFVDNPPYVCWIGFTAPAALYAKYEPHFAKCASSIRRL